jgi:hypothetical protein
MGFEEEVAKLQRIRVVYLDFSQVNNPSIVLPNEVRLFGKSYDNRGPIPVIGTVESFGTFNRSLVNADLAMEIPNLSIMLLDPENEWRTLAAPPSQRLMYRWAHLMLRVLDDERNVYDQRVAVGQITVPRFPAGKKAELNLQITGGKWLGEMVPRRLVTVQDFPRCAPENVGKAVPIVFGRVSNIYTSADSDTTEASAVPCSARSEIILQETFSNGASEAFALSGVQWDATVSGADPLYTGLALTEGVDISINGGPGIGTNAVVGSDPYAGSGGTVNDAYGVGALVWTALGSQSKYAGAWTGLWDATQMHLTFAMKHTADALDLANFYYYPLIQFLTYALGFDGPGMELTLVSETFGTTTHPQYRLAYSTFNNETQDDTETVVLVDAPYADIQDDEWHTYTVCYQCGTYSYDGTDVAVEADGWLKVYRDDTLLFEVNDIALILGYGEYESTSGTDRSNYLHSLAFGFYGLAGELAQISATAGATTEASVETQNCQDTPGLSDNLVSGAMRALLVDTGLSVDAADGEITDWDDDDIEQPNGTSNAAIGSGTITIEVYFVMAARVGTAVGPLSNYSNLSPDPARAAVHSWDAVGGSPDGYIVWMFDDPSFHPRTNPTVGNPRYKVVAADEETPLPFAGFDYAVSFASLEDGTAWVASTEDSTTDPEPTGYRYLLAGHTLRAVEQVYVRKPVPTVKDDAPTNVTTAAVAIGATQIQIVFNDDAERFRQGQIVLLAGDTETYEITDSNEGLLDITPPARVAFASGTQVAATTDVEKNVLQVEGEDYEQEVLEVNGNRYHTIVFYDRLQNSENCQQYEVTCNVQGFDINADGSGALINNGVSQFQHLLKNFIFNDYRSSVGVNAPPGGRWFEETSYSPGLIDNDSFYAANFISSGRVTGNYEGNGALVEQMPISQLIQELCASFDLDFYYDTGSGTGKWSVKMFDPGTVVRGDLTHYTPEDVIQQDSFELEFSDTLKHANVVPYFAGPMDGASMGASQDRNGGYMVSGQVSDPTSIALYGQQIAEPLVLRWTRHAPTAYDVAYRRLLRTRYPQITATCRAAIGVINDALASEVRVTHPDGLGLNGWQARVCRVLRSDIDLDSMTVVLTLLDVDDLVP